MFERKMIQSSVEPAENKSFSNVDVTCTIYELAVCNNYNWALLPEWTSGFRSLTTNRN